MIHKIPDIKYFDAEFAYGPLQKSPLHMRTQYVPVSPFRSQ